MVVVQSTLRMAAVGLLATAAVGAACVLAFCLPSWQQIRLSRTIRNKRTGQPLPNSEIKLPLGDMPPELADALKSSKQRLQFADAGAAGFWTLGTYVAVLLDADWLRELLMLPDRMFRRTFEPLHTFARIIGRSLISAEGEDWARQHKIMYKAFQPSALAAYVPLYANRARALADRLAAVAAAGGQEDMMTAFNDLALGVMVDAGFGAAVSAEDYKIIFKAFRFIMREAQNPVHDIPGIRNLPLPSSHELERQFSALHAAADRIIAARKAMHASGQYQAAHDGTYVIDMLLDAQDSEAALTDLELRDNVIMLLLAGSETTATGMTWTLWHICSRPAVLARVRAEVDGVELDGLNSTQLDARLPYLTMVLNESLRINPPIAGIAERIFIDEYTIGELHVPAGGRLGSYSLSMHYNPAYWERPDEFDPERFSEAGVRRQHRGAYIPFGLGRRQCLGRVFALNEIRVVIASLLKRFDFFYDTSAGPVTITWQPPSLVPAAGMPMRVRLRATCSGLPGNDLL